MGTERHEAGRIDRQLRGRSGRQGDPGSSRFYISLEDDLMRLFGSDKIVSIMDRLGVQEGEAITAGLVTKAIAKAQARVEDHNYEIRKHLLEYDDLMNRQREVIYELRQELLKGVNISQWILEVLVKTFAQERTEKGEAETGVTLREFILAVCTETLEMKMETMTPDNMPKDDWDLKGLLEWFHSVLPTSNIRLKDLQGDEISRQDIYEKLSAAFTKAYDERETLFTGEGMRFLEKAIVLRTVDTQWRDHLLSMDMLRDSVGLKAFGATVENAALIEYKKEGHELFVQMLETIKREILDLIFKVSPVPPPDAQPPRGQGPQNRKPIHPEQKPRQPVQTPKKIGRNDPCPCGSGKKYKKCCGANVLA